MGYFKTRVRINLLVYNSLCEGEEGTAGGAEGFEMRVTGMGCCNIRNGLLHPELYSEDLPELYGGTRNDDSTMCHLLLRLGLKPYEDSEASGKKNRGNWIIGAVISSQWESGTCIQVDSGSS